MLKYSSVKEKTRQVWWYQVKKRKEKATDCKIHKKAKQYILRNIHYTIRHTGLLLNLRIVCTCAIFLTRHSLWICMQDTCSRIFFHDMFWVHSLNLEYIDRTRNFYITAVDWNFIRLHDSFPFAIQYPRFQFRDLNIFFDKNNKWKQVLQCKPLQCSTSN